MISAGLALKYIVTFNMQIVKVFMLHIKIYVVGVVKLLYLFL